MERHAIQREEKEKEKQTDEALRRAAERQAEGGAGSGSFGGEGGGGGGDRRFEGDPVPEQAAMSSRFDDDEAALIDRIQGRARYVDVVLFVCLLVCR
jgi:hypothetical protein